MMSSENPAICDFSQIALYRNDDGSLRVDNYPIRFDSNTEQSLKELAKKMTEWDAYATRKLRSKMMGIDPRFHVERGDTVVQCLMQRYIDDVKTVFAYVQEEEPVWLTESTLHEWWIDQGSISRLYRISAAIKEYEVDRETICAVASKLEMHESSQLQNAYEDSVALQELLREALGEYESRFEDYVECAESTLPGIIDRKEYCRSFRGAYGEGELDYDITPGNNVIVKSIEEYIHAYKLEQAYAEFDEMEEGAIIANRFLGKHQYNFDIDEACDLSVVLRTNFGYGRSSYFNSTLSYKGISAINAYFVIFYRVERMAEFSGSTYSYEVDESSFPICFDKIKEINNEYHSIGEARFVDKYFRQSLVDIVKLLSVVANTDTFLNIDSPNKLSILTNEKTIQLVPLDDFNEIKSDLSASEKKLARELGNNVLEYIQNEEMVRPGEDKVIDHLICKLSESGNCRSVLQRLARLELVRNEVASVLRESDVSSEDISRAVNRLLPREKDMYATKLSKYKLIEYRVDTVSRVLPLLGRIKKISKLVDFGEVTEELYSIFKQVCIQTASYIREEISPKLKISAYTKNDLQRKLEGLHVQKEQLSKEQSDTAEIDECIDALEDELRPIIIRVRRLKEQRAKLEAFINSVDELDISACISIT